MQISVSSLDNDIASTLANVKCQILNIQNQVSITHPPTAFFLFANNKLPLVLHEHLQPISLDNLIVLAQGDFHLLELVNAQINKEHLEWIVNVSFY